MSRPITCLAGGVGAARFLQGLVKVLPQENISVIVNTADDIDLYGLHISPDLDIVMYTIAGIVDEDKGWGIKDDTFNCLRMLREYGSDTWFKIGDVDLATHIWRTILLRKGMSLAEVTKKLSKKLGVKMKILPMSNETVTPQIVTDAGKMHFEEYLVRREAKDKVLDVSIEGVDSAKPALGVIESIQKAKGIIVCPSNPIVSIGPILAINEIREAIRSTTAKVVAITPIVGGATIKGPADKLMRGLGLQVSAHSVASLYQDFLDVFILDEVDRSEKERIEALGIEVIATNTIMASLEDKMELAKQALAVI